MFDFNSSGHPPRMETVPTRQGKPVKGTGAQRSGSGPGARLYCTYFGVSALYWYLSVVQINPFRPSPSHSATQSQSFRFSVKIFSRSALAGGARKKIWGARTRCRLSNGNVSCNSSECIYVHENLFNIYSVCATEAMFISLVSNFRRVLNVVFFLLGDSLASVVYVPAFRNTLSVPSS